MTDAMARNLALSRVTVMLVFGFNAGANLLVIGVFARTGGLELVGVWAWLNAVVMNVLILDLGLTDTLTFRIGRDGLAKTAPLIRRTNRNGAGLIALAFTLSMASVWLAHPSVTATALAALAATLQLTSNWRISIRLGAHQQYWFNFKTMCRVAAQSLLAIGLMIHLPKSPELAIGIALLGGSFLELTFTLWANRHCALGTGGLASQKQLFTAAKAFTTTNIVHRAVQPLSVLLIGTILGTPAVAFFTIALRIPVVINQSISEALRGLLPGLAQLQNTNPKQIIDVLRDAFLAQVLLLIPLITLVFFGAEPILRIWLGSPQEDLAFSLRILLIAMAFSGLATPFHWANYALGQAKQASIAYVTCAFCQITLGGICLILTKNISLFIATFAICQIATALAIVIISQNNNQIASRVNARIRWNRIIVTLTVLIIFLVIIGFHNGAENQRRIVLEVLFTITLICVLSGPTLLRKKYLEKT